ncbi:MAG: aminodeoxychorismate synthase component I [Castellaniella sp.]
MICLFEDRIAGRALRLGRRVGRFAVHRREDLAQAWEVIAAAQARGQWLALLLDYELGWWLEPGLARQVSDRSARPLLTVLIHEDAQWQAPLPLPDDGGASLEQLTRALNPRPGVTQADYLRTIGAIQAGIARGDYYQINYTLPLALDWPRAGGHDIAHYQALASRHPVAYAACIQDGDRAVLSLSPELFLQREGGVLRTRPMKGTAPRFADPDRDQASARALQASEKNRAENLMIVDLLRNDLGRVAAPGSVRVRSLFDLEAYPSVWTLTSSVEARAPDAPFSEILQALFPCGSVTGAPKIAAMRAIRAFEQRDRGIYCGSVGWMAPDGDFCLNVAIRTIEINRGVAAFGVGGGIVIDSDAAEEWEECWWKARVLRPS